MAASGARAHGRAGSDQSFSLPLNSGMLGRGGKFGLSGPGRDERGLGYYSAGSDVLAVTSGLSREGSAIPEKGGGVIPLRTGAGQTLREVQQSADSGLVGVREILPPAVARGPIEDPIAADSIDHLKQTVPLRPAERRLGAGRLAGLGVVGSDRCPVAVPPRLRQMRSPPRGATRARHRHRKGSASNGPKVWRSVAWQASDGGAALRAMVLRSDSEDQPVRVLEANREPAGLEPQAHVGRPVGLLAPD